MRHWMWVLVAMPLQTSAQDAKSLWSRETLTGDWGGARSALEQGGVSLRLAATGFYQDQFSGSGDQDAGSAGRGDLWLDFDSEKLGLWAGGGLKTHVEYSGGDLQANRGGALFPVNTAAALPVGQRDELVATSIYLTQRLGKATSLMIGKINAVDLLAGDPFFGGWGIDRFMHIAFVAPPSGVLPPVIMGAIVAHRTGPYSVTGMIYDPNDQTDNYSLNGLFADGVNLSLSGKWTGEAGGRTTSVALTGIYSTKDGADLSQILLPPNLRTSEESASWNVSVQVGHLLVESQALPGQGLGVYAKAAVADGNPNPIRASIVGGVAGHGLVKARPRDSFGVGYFYYNLSDQLQDALDPLLRFGDEQGFEVYYRLALTPWLRLSADLQIVDPALQDARRATVGALRLNMVF